MNILRTLLSDLNSELMSAQFLPWSKALAKGLCRKGFPTYKNMYSRLYHQSARLFSLSSSAESMPDQPDDLKKRKIIEMEMQSLKECGDIHVPDKITEKFWPKLISIDSKFKRKQFYKYLKGVEIRTINKEENKIKRIEQKETQILRGHLVYGLGDNTMFYSIRQSAQAKYYNLNLYHAALFGQNLVLEGGWFRYMNGRDIQNFAEQIRECYLMNRLDKEPFNLHVCNVTPGSNIAKKVLSTMSALSQESFLLTFSKESYLDLFPNEKLVYLSPNCEEELVNPNSDDIYVIGQIVSESAARGLAKARKEKIKVARIPYGKTAQFNTKKRLSLSAVLKELLILKNGDHM